MCKICEALDKGGTYEASGSWAVLRIEKYGNKFWAVAKGDGRAEMEIHFCPECGKKLGDE